MCGIFGAVGAPLDRTNAARALLALRHRGPEASGLACPQGATLGHTRLKIIDLSEAGAQPMSNEDGSVWVTFNGEIYNFADLRRDLICRGHTFRSQSDTEVLVHGYEEWGTDLVDRIDGMFAFGIWDVARRRLFLARDRAGKKPLFYALHEGRFLFASEQKALFAAGVPLGMDPKGLVGYLAYGYAPPPGSLYQGVFHLPPASRLTLDLPNLDARATQPRVDQYWRVDFSPRTQGSAPTEAVAAAQVRHLLTEAVRRRLVADVPVGAFLSGGLDSTIIVALMARLGHKPRTFSIGFSGDPRYDETHFARTAAQAFATDHTEFKVTPADFELVETLVYHHDGPFGDSSAIPTYVVSRLTREHVTVALTGDGGDELFAGYLRFWAAQATERIPAPLRDLGARVAPFLPTGTGTRSFVARARRLLLAAGRPLGDRLTAWNSYFATDLPAILRPELLEQIDPALSYHRNYFADGRGTTALARTLNHNFDTYLPHDLLVKMDRTSMAHALEARAPFLDTALIEYVAGLPDDFKLRGRTTKYLLRKAFADLLPPQILNRGKMGFGLPLGTWFRGDLRSYLSDLIAVPTSRINDYVQPEAVARILREHADKKADHEHQLWALLTLELALRHQQQLTAFATAAIETSPPVFS